MPPVAAVLRVAVLAAVPFAVSVLPDCKLAQALPVQMTSEMVVHLLQLHLQVFPLDLLSLAAAATAFAWLFVQSGLCRQLVLEKVTVQMDPNPNEQLFLLRPHPTAGWCRLQMKLGKV